MEKKIIQFKKEFKASELLTDPEGVETNTDYTRIVMRNVITKYMEALNPTSTSIGYDLEFDYTPSVKIVANFGYNKDGVLPEPVNKLHILEANHKVQLTNIIAAKIKTKAKYHEVVAGTLLQYDRIFGILEEVLSTMEIPYSYSYIKFTAEEDLSLAVSAIAFLVDRGTVFACVDLMIGEDDGLISDS